MYWDANCLMLEAERWQSEDQCEDSDGRQWVHYPHTALALASNLNQGIQWRCLAKLYICRSQDYPYRKKDEAILTERMGG